MSRYTVKNGKRYGFIPKSAFKKGITPWNKGKSFPQAKNLPQAFEKGHTPWDSRDYWKNYFENTLSICPN